MPVFDGKNLTNQDDGEALLALILYPSREVREEARERGRMRAERASMLAEIAPAVPGTTLSPITPRNILPVT